MSDRTETRLGPGVRGFAWARALATAALAFVTAVPGPAAPESNVARTVHNLTPGGPGAQKETVETGVCVFCHTPHTANPQRALWNRDAAAVSYRVYTSASMRAEVNQPTGSSRLCLSCHDGTVALGALRAPPKDAKLALGPMTGKNVLGTDLSGSHPVSFVYDAALPAKHPGLVDPAALPKDVRLDSTRQLQCTTCHDPHEARIPHFLRNENKAGALCLACHQPPGWAQSAHATSTATWSGSGTSPWPPAAPQNVAANACNNCHRTHAAAHGARLMARPVEADNCTVCHDGSLARKNVAAEFGGGAKASSHPVNEAQWTHDPVESGANMGRHVTCADCHNAHVATGQGPAGSGLPGSLQGVPGISAGGAPVAAATREYEICNKCHGTREPTTPGIVRADATRIVGARIASGKSSHPIAAGAAVGMAARRVTSLSRRPAASPGAATAMGCIDCHNNSDWNAAGTAPKGPHASRYAPILALNYATNDGTPESSASYELCYSCHERNALMVDGPGRFPHRTHVVDRSASCAACHDAHGSRQSPHLIDFMVRDLTGRAVVGPNAKGRLTYTSAAPGQGSCDLACHGADHDARAYGTTALTQSQSQVTPSAGPSARASAAAPPLPLAPSNIGPMRATPSLRAPGGK